MRRRATIGRFKSTAHTGSPTGKGRAVLAFTRLFSATAALTGAAMTEKTVARACISRDRQPGRSTESLCASCFAGHDLAEQTECGVCRSYQTVLRRKPASRHTPAEAILISA